MDGYCCRSLLNRVLVAAARRDSVVRKVTRSAKEEKERMDGSEIAMTTQFVLLLLRSGL